MAYVAIPTLAGQTAIAAAIDGVAPLTIAEMVVGDGGGSATTPVETQTSLVNVRALVPISNHSHEDNMSTFDALMGVDVGGFYVREAGLLDEDGVLLFVASIPETLKLTTSDGAFDELTIGLMVVVSDTATVIIQPPPGSLLAVSQMLRAPHITVNSMTLATPPVSPADDATYVVPTGATGAWAGQTGKLTQWNGTTWVFKAVPINHFVGATDTGGFYKRLISSWEQVYFSPMKISKGRRLYHACF